MDITGSSQNLHQQPQPSQHLYQHANQCHVPSQYPPANWYDTWDRQASQSFSSTTKGLQNAPGENNCFLNSAVQVFWHIDVFRRSYRRLTGHLCMGNNSCIFCALKVIFTQFQYSDQSSLPPNALRKALAGTFSKQERFQLGHMDDAAECFENILRRIHYHIANSQNEDTCNIPHCLPHQKFAMKVSDQLVCPCSASSNPLTFQEMVHYVSASALVNQSRAMHENGDILHPDRFGLLLRNAGTSGDVRDCPANCGRRVQIRRTLLNTPDVVSIGLVWDSDHPDADLTTEVAQSIGTVLLLPDIFHVVMCDNVASLPKLHLSAMVCYYGKHYFTFVYHTKLQEWIYFDDTTVRQIGSHWENVVDKCSRGRYQPLLLIYTNPTATPISTETAPQKRVMAPGYSIQGPDDHETQKEGPVNSVQQTSICGQDIPNSRSTPHVEAYQHPSSSRSYIANLDKSKPEGETELTRKSSFDHRRQTSFLFAVSGKETVQPDFGQGSSHSELSVVQSSGNQQIRGREFYARNNPVRSVTEEFTRQDVPDAYSYTLSTNDQYRRPTINQADPSRVPSLTLNISRASDVQKKDSFRRGKGKIPADVIRYQVDPSRYSSTSSSESEGSPIFPSSVQNDSAPEGQKQPVITPNHIRTRSQSVEDSLGENSQEIVSNSHKVVKPKPTIPQGYESINNSSHTPVQSGLATLPRKKKTVNGKQTSEMIPQSQHIHARQNSQSGEIKPPRQTSLKDGITNFNANFQQGFYPSDHQAIRLSQDALMAHNNCQAPEIQMAEHSRQSSSSSIQSQNTVVELPQGEINRPASSHHSRQSSLVGQEPIAEKTKEKTKSSSKSRKEEKRSKLKNKAVAQNAGKSPKCVEKKANDVDEGFHDERYYIDRRMVESVLSFQKLQRQGSIQSTLSQTSNSSLDSDNITIKEKGQVMLKDNLSREIPFDNVSIGSHKDSGYGSSDRNSSSSTGSVTLNPYEQYFMSRSMIPPKTFSVNALNENAMKVLGHGNTQVAPVNLKEHDLKSFYQNLDIACLQNQSSLHCTEVSQPNPQLTKSQSTLLNLSNMSRDEKNLQIYEILKSRSKPVQPPMVSSEYQGHQQQAQILDGKPPVGSSHRNSSGQQRDLFKQNRDGYEERNYMNITTTAKDNNQEIKTGDKVYQDLKSDSYLDEANPTPHGIEQYSPPGSSLLPGYNEVTDGDFLGLCRQAEDLMDQCVLAETSQEFQQALNYCQKAIDCLKQAMKLPNISQQSYVFAQMRHNSCVLKSRSLQKKSLMRQESNTSTNSSDSERPLGGRSPVTTATQPDSPPHDSYQKCLRASAFQYLQPQAVSLQNRPPSRSSSQNSLDSLKDGRSSSGSSSGQSSTPVGGERIMQQPVQLDKTLTPGVENKRFSELQDRLNSVQANVPNGATLNSVDIYRSLQHRHPRGAVDFNLQPNSSAAKDADCNKQRTSSNPDLQSNHVKTPSVTSGSSTPTPMDIQDYYVNSSFVLEQFQKTNVNNQNNMTGKAEVRQLITKQTVNTYTMQQDLVQGVFPQTCNVAKAVGSESKPQQGTDRRTPSSTRLQVTEVGNKNVKSLPFPPAKPDWLKPGDKVTSGQGNQIMGQLIVRKLPSTTFTALQTAHSENVQTSVQAGQCMPVPTHSANTLQSSSLAFAGSQKSHLARSASFSALDYHLNVPSINAVSVYNSKPDTSSNSNMTEVRSDTMNHYSSGPNQPSISSAQQLSCNPSSIAPLKGVCSNSTNNSDSTLETRLSVRDLACRFESSTNIHVSENGDRQVNNSNMPLLGVCENVPAQEQISKVGFTAHRQRSKSESKKVSTRPRPKSVLSKRNKMCEDRPRKSVTFSDDIAMIAAADSWESAIAAQMTCGYVSDEENEELHKLQSSKGDHCDNELDDDSSESPVEIVGDAACSLCHKNGVEFGQSYCAKCTLYMSRFMPSR